MLIRIPMSAQSCDAYADCASEKEALKFPLQFITGR